MPIIGYKPQCEARKRGTFYYSDFKFPCKKEEVVFEEDFETLENSEEDLDKSEFEGEDVANDVESVLTIKNEPVHEELPKKTKKKKRRKKCRPPSLSPEDPYPCYRPVPHNYDVDFLARWKEKEKENFGRPPVICPKPQDSYEELIKQPICSPRPLPSPSPPPTSLSFLNPCTPFFSDLNFGRDFGGKSRRQKAHFEGTFSWDEIPTIPCLLCDGTLYEMGFVHDLHDKVRKIRQESLLKNDNIAQKIGFSTRITVHKLCYEEYIRRPFYDAQEERSTIYS